MTEKLWNAFVAGCVPIYLGPPNIKVSHSSAALQCEILSCVLHVQSDPHVFCAKCNRWYAACHIPLSPL